MDWPLTLTLGALALALVVLFGWLGARPFDPRRGPRLLPYRFLMLLAAVGMLLIVVHALNLLGLQTGH